MKSTTSAAFIGADIHCPIDGGLCIIDATSSDYEFQLLRSANFYVSDSFNGIQLTCHPESYENDLVRGCWYQNGYEPTMHCLDNGVSTACTMDLIQPFDGWSCVDTDSVCQRSLLPTTAFPTTI